MENRESLEEEIKKCVEGVLPTISSNFYSRYNSLLFITLILSLVPLLTYIIL